MKNRTKFVGIIALFALVGFSFVACEGARGPRGHEGIVPPIVLEVHNAAGNPVEADYVSRHDVYARQGSIWDFGRNRPGAAPATEQGGWTAGLGDATGTGDAQWNAAVPPQPGVRNFMAPFSIYNPGEHAVTVRLFISNGHDFMFGGNPRAITPIEDPVYDTPPDSIGQLFSVIIEAEQSHNFWITARTGNAGAGAAPGEVALGFTGWGRTAGTPTVDGEITVGREAIWWPSLGNVADMDDVEFDYYYDGDDYTADASIRRTRVQIDISPHTPWVSFNGNGNAARTLSFYVEVELEENS